MMFTISLVREAKPKKLFKYFETNNVEITMPYKGIYYVHGISLFPVTDSSYRRT